MGLDTYMQKAHSTLKTELLVLEMKHYERLLVKRNPRTIEMMKEALEPRLRSRLSRHAEMPLMKCLCFRAHDYVEQKQQQTEARQSIAQHGAGGGGSGGKQPRSMAATFDSFVPPRGALVDIHGPGTVFHRIREREKARQMKMQKGRKMFGGASRLRPGQGSRTAPGGSGGVGAGGGVGTGVGRRDTANDDTDPVLTNLENRMRAWLSNETNGSGGQQRSATPRIAKLHRGGTEVGARRSLRKFKGL